MAVQTLNDIYLETLKKPRRAAQMFKKAGVWVDIPLDDFERIIHNVSGGLRWLGVKKGDRVAILSENRPEWAQSDVGSLAAGAVTVPIYSTLQSLTIEYILNDSGSVVLFCSNADQLKKIVNISPAMPALRKIVVFDPPSSMPEMAISWKDFLARGAEQEQADGKEKFDQLLRSSTASDMATIVYTSGTTGNPKGAVLTHGNLTSNVVTCSSMLPIGDGDIALNILPLSHILERMVDFAYFYLGSTIAYAEGVNQVAANLQEVRPHTFAAVPRIFEKMKERMINAVADYPPMRKKIFYWSVGIAAERLPYRVKRTALPPMLAVRSAIAEKFVFSKIQERLGGRCRFVVSGGAPLSSELAAFFIGAGVEIVEGYGLTETSPVISFNTLEHRKIGTVGRPIAGVEVRIASDGEIVTRGPNVMTGYFNNPEATAAAIDSEGWFHTGDIGLIDPEGYLKITDRKKDLIISAYGKNIAPQPIEGLLKTSSYVGTPVLIGDRRKYIAAVIVPNFEALQREAKQLGLGTLTNEALVKHPQIVAVVQKEIDRFNAQLDKQEKIKKFVLIATEFSIDGGELTPSLKVKRRVVDEKYKDLIDEMYKDDDAA